MKVLTITVPAYNVEKTLSATLDSLCACKILPELDILIIDDGSADSTYNIASKYEKKYPDSVRTVKKQNGGHGSAVNKGIELARGKYFKVVDGDDRLDNAGLTALVKRLGQTDADLVASNCRKVLPDGSPCGDMNYDGVEYGVKYDFDKLPADGSVYYGIHSSTFKTDILRKSGVKLQEHTFYVDAEYALLPMPFVRTVEFLENRVYLYTVGSEGQSVNIENFVARYDDHLRVVQKLADFAKICSTDEKHRDYIYSVTAKLCFTQYMLAAFYDSDIQRGQVRARSFDAWLKGDPRLYAALNSSVYIKFLRATGFRILPRSVKMKKAAKSLSAFFKRITGRKKLTY